GRFRFYLVNNGGPRMFTKEGQVTLKANRSVILINHDLQRKALSDSANGQGKDKTHVRFCCEVSRGAVVGNLPLTQRIDSNSFNCPLARDPLSPSFQSSLCCPPSRICCTTKCPPISFSIFQRPTPIYTH